MATETTQSNQIQININKSQSYLNDEKESKDNVFISNDASARIENPLVVIVGIGDFKGQYPQLMVERDYQNIIFAFNYTRGYHIVYYNPKNKIMHLASRANRSNDYHKSNFKKTWEKTEIVQFNKEIKEMFLTNNNNNYYYDSLIYIVSTHGHTKGIIYDSDCEEIKINSIITEFDNVNCKSLKFKPKIFILDHCRGKKVSRMMKNSLYQHQNADKIKQQSCLSKSNQQQQPQTKQYNKSNKKQTKDDSKRDADATKNVADMPIVNKASDICKIFANVDNYATPGGGDRGGYLIRYLTKVLINDDWFKGINLSKLILKTRLVLQHYLGDREKLATQVIDVLNTIACDVKFYENEKVLPSSVTITNSQNQMVSWLCVGSAFDC